MFTNVFEALERRHLLSASVTNGVLAVVGTPGPDVMDVSGSGSSIVSDVNNSVQTFSGVISIVIQGEASKDLITIESSIPATMPVTVMGGAGGDTINAYSGSGELLGQQGADEINTQDGSPFFSQYLIVGGVGNDMLSTGNVANDIIRGGPGNDTLSAADGLNVLQHGFDQSILTGGAGANEIISNNDTATIISISGADTIIGNQYGDNLIWALAAGDSITGHTQTDLGDVGSDTIYTVGSTSNDDLGGTDFINLNGATAPSNAAQLLPFANSVTDPSQI